MMVLMKHTQTPSVNPKGKQMTCLNSCLRSYRGEPGTIMQPQGV